jgi:hypothetical protein
LKAMCLQLDTLLRAAYEETLRWPQLYHQEDVWVV